MSILHSCEWGKRIESVMGLIRDAFAIRSHISLE